MERLNKLVARAGLASRRGADQLITEGRVSVNGKTIVELGAQADPDRDSIRVDGRKLPGPPRRHTYLLLNKPRGVVTTMADPQGRPTIRDLLPRGGSRVFPIGRLDFHSEGLLLLTDDGEMARRLMHPRSGVKKTYSVKVRGTPELAALKRLERGIRIDGRRTLPARIIVTSRGPNSWLEVTVTEGRKHLVRRLLASIRHPVSKLRRVDYGGVRLGDVPAGAVRRLTEPELKRLRSALETPRKRPLRRGAKSA